MAAVGTRVGKGVGTRVRVAVPNVEVGVGAGDTAGAPVGTVSTTGVIEVGGKRSPATVGSVLAGLSVGDSVSSDVKAGVGLAVTTFSVGDGVGASSDVGTGIGLVVAWISVGDGDGSDAGTGVGLAVVGLSESGTGAVGAAGAVVGETEPPHTSHSAQRGPSMV